MKLLRGLLAGRWPLLLLTVPYTILWTQAAASGGWLTVLAHAALVLYGFACFDALMLDRAGEVRLGLRRERGAIDPEHLEICRIVTGATAGVLGVILLVVEPWVGVSVLAALAILALLSLGRPADRPRWAMRWLEVILPVAALLLPALVIRSYAASLVASDPEAGGAMSGSVLLATLLGAVMLAGYVLLCFLRDEDADRGEGFSTTATILGRGGATVVLFLIFALASLVAIRGTGLGAWAWPLGMGVAVLGMFTLWASAQRAGAIAVGVWAAGSAVIALSLSIELA